MIGAETDDDIVASTVRGDVRGTRYPHILNHISTYTIPSIDEVLNLYHEYSSPCEPLSDLEQTYLKSSKSGVYLGEEPTRERDCGAIAASISHAYAGADVPQAAGPGWQVYNIRYAYPSGLSADSSSNGPAPKSTGTTSATQTVYRRDSWESTSSMSDGDDAVYLSTIPEEPELEADTEDFADARKS
ncbi:hypothetical protein SLS56_000129 [Neofusicoccum ribis]|uniref:Uncharacterized protein n=1 Tax=Neofusicoccum ribis TaxID=45134 RepID=A0ABR3TFZ2_9PEZI